MKDCKTTTQMSASCWNGRLINASRKNRQQQEEVQHRDAGVGNGTQHSAIANILEN